MALIRQSDKSSPLTDAIVYRLGDLVREGTELREQTTRQVDSMLTHARAERDRLIANGREEGLKQGREQGHREGFAKGEEEGRTQAIAKVSAQLATLMAGWNKTLDEFEKGRDALLLEARTEVLRLAVEIGRAVVKREIEFRPEAVIEQMEAALRMVIRPSRVRLSVHPEDRPMVERALPGILTRCTNATHVEVEDDVTGGRGSCVVRMAGGEVDASIGVQLERIVQAIVPSTPTSEALKPDTKAATKTEPMADEGGA
ncbi:MAG: FliH/SctL family protein [Phycisphaerales bacterium]